MTKPTECEILKAHEALRPLVEENPRLNCLRHALSELEEIYGRMVISRLRAEGSEKEKVGGGTSAPCSPE